MSSNLVIPENELPTWMKQAQRGVDWGAILVLGFCLLVAWPFLSQESIPAFYGEHYVYRTADYAEALKEGNLYPRWSPHVLGGYGAEIPNYYPPGAAYLAAVVEVLFTNDSVAAVRFSYVMSFLLAGVMVYTFVKQHTNALSGIIASLLYIFSPFVALTVPHVQGDLDLAFSIALLPTFLWAINRLMMRNHTLDYLLIAIICATIIVTKPIMLIQAFLLTIVLFAVYFQKQVEWRKLGLTLSAIIAGIGLSAFYWIPAWLERGFVTWSDALILAPDNRLTLAGLFALTQLVETDILVRDPQFNLSWMIIGFTILTIITLIFWRKNIFFSLTFLITGILLSILGLTFFSKHTELLASIILCFAIASSYPISILPKKRIGLALSALALILIFMGTFPIWQILEPPFVIRSDSMISQEDYEEKGWGIAILSPGQAIPSSISPMNSNLPDLSSISPNGRIVNNSSFQSTVLEENNFGGQYRIITPDDTSITSIRYLQAYSIGWHASIDGQALAVSNDEDGLVEISFPDNFMIPATENGVLSISHGTTPIRIISWSICLFSIIIIMSITWQRWQNIDFNFDSSDLLTSPQITIVVCFLATGVLLLYPPIYEFANSKIPYPVSDITKNATSIQNNIGELELWRFKFEDHPHQAGDILDLTLFWRLYKPINHQHQVRLRLISRDGQTIHIIDHFQYPSQVPSNRWPANLVVADMYKIPLPQDLASGSYTIMLDVASCPEICLQGSRIPPQSITTIQLPQSLIIKK